MSREPVILKCEYCKQIIYEDEEYRRADEFNPDCHETCLDLQLKKEREEYKAMIAGLKEKEARGEELTWDELWTLNVDETNERFRKSMFEMIFGKKE